MRVIVIGLALFAVQPALAGDELISNAIRIYASPAFAEIDCSVLKKAGLDKMGHTIDGVCYDSNGATSHFKIDATLSCRASSEGAVSNILGARNAPSVSEKVSVEADIKGSDCSVL